MIGMALMAVLMGVSFASCDKEEEEEGNPNGGSRTAVDLGLSVKWASCNVGASSPEEYGDYFAWGEIKEKKVYGWDNYKWFDQSSYNGGFDGPRNTLTKYCTNSDYGTVDNKTMLDPEDDVAHVGWGDGWRMPTSDEINELLENCSWKWTTVNGVNGCRVTGPNGNSIFLPAAGRDGGNGSDGDGDFGGGSEGNYWSSTLDESSNDSAYDLYFDDSDSDYYEDERSWGYSVRPVKD